MSLNITGRNLDITPAIRDYVKNKIGRIEKHFDNVVDSQVMLSIERLKHTAEVTVRVPGKDIHCASSDENLYAAIDLLADKIDRQILKYKEKANSHAHEPAKRLEVPAV
ncbi:ribosomal subunit interface protein [Alcaligenes pakistanensis]|uniref:Ribosome hibernation promoting factor n=1 Tax=Alcaligenes pakistanensis TaxID=1482717 RepID=A0A8H9IQG4_9BURK|nr:ribosome-associated translation inhibitor RaiA [Alcaligenes pakistanensis]MBP6622605.1 ribosome-associated translation inhibitor RaiA [Alcaligenes sp.]GHC49440.1 ribosomal subunit interface protein [Alcaligenes pakistanensis]HCA17733.1 ribosome-associated translation inhibitor RaiA [Alcaligenes faecalis]